MNVPCRKNIKKKKVITTVPDVFIIESLKEQDEDNYMYEGRILSDILRLSGKTPKYYYFKTKEELTPLVQLFVASRYRYLHLSAHAGGRVVSVGGENVPYEDFSTYFQDALNKKRMFLSACLAGNSRFANAMLDKNQGIISIAAPKDKIAVSQGIAFWSAFYTSSFNDNSEGMESNKIVEKLEQTCKVFQVNIYFKSKKIEKTIGDYPPPEND